METLKTAYRLSSTFQIFDMPPVSALRTCSCLLAMSAMYYTGQHGVDKDMDMAVDLFEMAADEGHPTAQYVLGLMCYDGKDVPLDRDKALELIRASAEQGYGTAQNALKQMGY
jgi:TPR repeat protein